MYALIDCNNFFVSCERIFKPHLVGKPVVVLSNNDGCVVARSKEAKLLNIPMGAPIFKYKELVKNHGVYTLSSNFTLYGDISSRVFEILSSFDLPMEIYSIDEAFIQVPDKNAEMLAHEIRNKLSRWLRMPVSIGLSTTKTRAKAANSIAKQKEAGAHILKDKDLSSFPIGDVWGIGYRFAEKLRLRGVKTAMDLIHKDEAWIRKLMHVGGLQTYLELKGTPCESVIENTPPRKTMTVSRSFSTEITDIKQLEEKGVLFISKAFEKLRKHSLTTGYIQCYLATNRFKGKKRYLYSFRSFPLPTSYTPLGIAAIKTILQEVYDGSPIKKMGVFLSELCSKSEVQQDFFGSSKENPQLMELFDSINRKYGAHTVTFSKKLPKTTYNQQYTTSWDDLLSFDID
jgi:DNA polymerase V